MANKQTAVEQLKNEFFGYADPYPHFSEEDKWAITERELFELIEKAKAMEIEQSQKYAEFCVECDRKGMPLLDFKSWIEL